MSDIEQQRLVNAAIRMALRWLLSLPPHGDEGLNTLYDAMNYRSIMTGDEKDQLEAILEDIESGKLVLEWRLRNPGEQL